MSLGYAELTPDGHHYNTQILTDRTGAIVGKYRKVHLPGHAEFDPERSFQHLEKRYFEPGDLGFPVWRNMDAWMGMNDLQRPPLARGLSRDGAAGGRVDHAGLQHAFGKFPGRRSRGPRRGFFIPSCRCRLAPIRTPAWVVAVAKAGVEDGNPMIAGSVIVDPNGLGCRERAATDGDELLVHPCDMDVTCDFGKATIFDFKRHRRVEHYGRITGQVGVIYPDGKKG